MADWGAGLQGLAGGLTKGYQLGLATQEEQTRRQQMEQQAAVQQQQLAMQQQAQDRQAQAEARQAKAAEWVEEKGNLEFWGGLFKDDNIHPKVKQSIYDTQIRPYAEKRGNPLPEHDFIGAEDTSFSKKFGGLLGSVAKNPKSASVAAASIREWAMEPGRTKTEMAQAGQAVGDVFKMGETARKEESTQANLDLRRDIATENQNLRRELHTDRVYSEDKFNQQQAAKEETEKRGYYRKATEQYRGAVQALQTRADAAERSGIPMTPEAWNAELQGIYAQYGPVFEEGQAQGYLGKGWGAAKGAKALDKTMAQKLLAESGGDKEKARALAKQRGYTF